tara:strand:+ start:467 stop:760 length:294 start_codon:yes stop_codon:yes gene_type:complete
MADMSSVPSTPSGATPNSAAALAAPQTYEPSTAYKDAIAAAFERLIRTQDRGSTDTQRYLFIMRYLSGLRDTYNENRSSSGPPRQAPPLAASRRLEF